MKPAFSLILLFAATGLLIGCQPAAGPDNAATTPAETAADTPAPAPVAAPAGSPVPKPEFPTLVVDTFDGGRFDLAQRRGKWVVVNFWATWCNPCLKEIPDLNAFDKAREDVEIIGLAYEEIEKADMEAFLRQHVIEYPIAVIDVYNPPADFETPRGLPMTYLIAPDGKVARHFLGPITSAELAKAMEAHAGAKPTAG